MPELTNKKLAKLLSEVARTKSSFKVVFPWGFRIVELGGEKVLQPLTPQEYCAAAAHDPGKKLTDIEMAGRPRCQCKLTNTAALERVCTEAGGGWCSYHCSDGMFYSICNYLYP